jgi:hypothetical protein
MLSKIGNVDMHTDSGEPLIHVAALGKRPKETVEVCLNHGAKINEIDTLGNTILFHSETVDMFEFYMKNRANANHRNYEGETCIFAFIRSKKSSNFFRSVCQWPLDLSLK